MNKNPFLIIIGRNIKKFRNKKKISQEELAFKAQVSPNYIGNIERGEYNPTILVLAKLAKALQIELKDILPSIKDIPL